MLSDCVVLKVGDLVTPDSEYGLKKLVFGSVYKVEQVDEITGNWGNYQDVVTKLSTEAGEVINLKMAFSKFRKYSPQPTEQDITTDRGKHYRYAFRLNLTQEDIDNGFVTVNIDPYRISEVYNLGGWREHLVKKAIRGTEKGHTEDELLEELQCTLDRAKQMLEESRE